MIILRNTFVLFVVAAVTFSCSTDEGQMDDNLNSTVLTADELQMVLETHQVSGVADDVLFNLFINDGTNGKRTSTDECYTTQYSDTGYTVNFDNCTLNGTDTLSGMLSVTYSFGDQNSTFTATYSDFYVNDMKLNGTRSFLLEGAASGNGLSFSITSAMDMVWADGTLVAENGTRVVGVSIGESLEDTVVTLNGNWNLAAGADVYEVTITDTLETKMGCNYISEGKMTVDKNGQAILVDFGNGTCDASAMITYPNGTTEEVSL